MSWNEPNGDKNPWGNRNPGGGPPDLDEIIRKMQRGLSGFFGNKSSGGSNRNNPAFPGLLIIAVLVAWLVFDSFHALDEQQRGVVLRFGEHVADLSPGLSLRFPRPIERVIRVNVGQVRSIKHASSMLTQDENIISVEIAVQWRIGDPAAFLFNIDNPEQTLRQTTESVVREVIGKGKLDFIMTEGRNDIAQQQQLLLQEVMDSYKSGVIISKVEMLSAKPPEAVKAAFDDAIKAREDEQRYVNQAEAYRNDIIPKARGGAARLREEANSYKARVISKAEGEASRFEQLYAEYSDAPEVTRQRLYLDAIESVFANSNKIFLDSENANSLMYLPIDKLLEQRREMIQRPSGTQIDRNRMTDNNTASERGDNRSRKVR